LYLVYIFCACAAAAVPLWFLITYWQELRMLRITAALRLRTGRAGSGKTRHAEVLP